MGNEQGKLRLRRVKYDSPRKLAMLEVEPAGKNSENRDLFLVTIKDANLRTVVKEPLTARRSEEVVKQWRKSYEHREEYLPADLPNISPETKRKSMHVSDDSSVDLDRVKGWAQKIQEYEDDTGRKRSYTT